MNVKMVCYKYDLILNWFLINEYEKFNFENEYF